MLSKTLGKNFPEGRLRLLLSVFFLALAIPTAALVWQAYSQLKWEAFHQYRGMAEELTRRINADLVAAIEASEARSFADYSFLLVSGDTSASFLQPSVLSTYPVPQSIPGLLGFFQVGTAGEFSTPLLPAADNPPDYYGISSAEYQQRQALAQELRDVLSNNKLVENRPVESTIDGLPGTSTSSRPATAATPKLAAGTTLSDELLSASPSYGGKRENEIAIAELALAASAAGQQVIPGTRQAPSSQRAFDKLNEARTSAYVDAEESIDRDDTAIATENSQERDYSLGRVADLKLDSAKEKKSADLEMAEQKAKNAPASSQYSARQTRKEQISLAEPILKVAGAQSDWPTSDDSLRIRTFESEIDPLEFSLLNSGHFVLFRTVWREGERFIQGMLLQQSAFIEGAIEHPFQDAALSAMSVLIVAYQEQVLSTALGEREYNYVSRAGELQGELLYRSRLAAPFDSLEVIYTVNQLPPGPGGALVAWVSLVLGLVLCLGFYGLYRMGLRQMRLARQQQDFVSAVSHELKTPLTSIRMYGEMLKEGWAAEDKKQAYYEFIFEESERLTRLISNVLQLSNISREKPQLEIRQVLVGEIVDLVQSKIETQIQRAGFKLVFLREPECDASMVSLDSDHFTQIIINLVDNAIKFSRKSDQKRVEIGARLSNDKRVVFSVRDFGPGIAKDQMRKIFDMFYRSESELTRETVGTGIGLAIVHQLSAAMGASVDVLNREPGAEFQVSVPVSSTRSV
jgi:two-component system phosphate regulon sensor histidine kinase PhoR